MNIETDTRRAAAPPTNDGIHIERPDVPDDAAIVTMLCGAQAYIFEDATVSPPDFDFFLFGCGDHKATCATCLAVRAAMIGAAL